MALPFNLIGAVIALICFVGFIVSCSTSWYTISNANILNSTCTVSTGHFTSGIGVLCTGSCPTQTVQGIRSCGQFYQFSSSNIAAACTNSQIYCDSFFRGSILRSTVALAALACVFCLLVGVGLLICHLQIPQFILIVPIINKYKILFVLAIVASICGLIALIILAAGWNDAVQRDTQCGSVSFPCPPLFDQQIFSDGSQYTSGIGVAYWLCLAFTVVSIVVIPFAWLGSSLEVPKQRVSVEVGKNSKTGSSKDAPAKDADVEEKVDGE